MRSLIILSGIVLIQTSTLVSQTVPSWYIESLIHTHHSTGQPAPEWEEQFRRVRPDAVQFHTLAYAEGKKLAEKYNFSMVATLNRSGGWDDIRRIVEALPEEEQKLFYRRVNPDGSPTGRMRDGRVWEHTCYYSPGIDKHIIPEYKKVTEQFHPAQFWIDHNVITVNLCYCPVCKENFRGQYGVNPPEVAGDKYWEEWIKYHRRGLEHWMEKVHDTVRSVDENTLVTFNHAYFLAQPEPPPSYVKNLSADIHSHPMSLCLFARYASTVGVPFDLMPGLTDRWAGTKPKTELEVLQTAAVITANGGRWNIGEFPMTRDKQPADDMLGLAAAGADMVHERREWTHNTVAVPLVAVLQTASTQYARVIPRPRYVPGESGEYVVSDNGTTVFMGKDNPGNTRIFWHNNHAMPHEISGAGAALLENNIPFDIINEATLKERLNEYKVLIIGDQFLLDKETNEAIRRFVKQGGGVLATGRTVESSLNELLGVRLSSEIPLSDGTIRLQESNIYLNAPLQIKVVEAEVENVFSGAGNFPAITSRTYGRGRILYVAADFFKTYMDVSPYTPWTRSREGNMAMRTAVKSWISMIAPKPGYSCAAPPWIEIALRGKDGNLLVHLVERTFEWRNDKPEIQKPIELSLSLKKRPQKVLLQPGNREIKWKWQNGDISAIIPVNEIKIHSILEIKGVL